MPVLRSHIGNKVRFQAPLSVRKLGAAARTGKIIDEVWALESQRDPTPHAHDDPDCWGDYAFCSQFIQWENGGYSIRLAYYRLPCKGERWQFASQTTVETVPTTVKALMERTLAKTNWFKKPEVGRY